MSNRIRQWFDKLEKVLAAQVEFAGLLKHNAIIGQLKIYLIASAPPSYSVTMKILSSLRGPFEPRSRARSSLLLRAILL